MDHDTAELKHTIDKLAVALQLIERDVTRAAKRYLKRSLDGPVTFSRFVEHLALDMREHALEWVKRKEFKAVISRELMKKIDDKVESLIPELKLRVHEWMRIPVLVRPNAEASIKKYKAGLLWGGMKHVAGVDPLDAYHSFRDRLMVKLWKEPEDILTAQRLLGEGWEKAHDLLIEKVQDYTIEVRVILA